MTTNYEPNSNPPKTKKPRSQAAMQQMGGVGNRPANRKEQSSGGESPGIVTPTVGPGGKPIKATKDLGKIND